MREGGPRRDNESAEAIGCDVVRPRRRVRGVLLAYQNTGGLTIIDNTVGGAVFNLGNSGAGPLPGQDEPIVRGNHRP